MKKRIGWIDRLRGFGFYFVILGHMKINDVIKSWIYSFHMPLFLIVTGLMFDVKKLSTARTVDYILKLFKRLLVPYLCMQIISLAIRAGFVGLYSHKLTDFISYFKGIVIGNSNFVSAPSDPSYYILLLFLAQAALFFIAKLTKGNRTAVTVICLLLLPISLFTIKKPMPWHINVTPVAMVFIMLGTYLSDLYKHFEEKIKAASTVVIFFISAAAAFGGLVLWRINGRFSLHGNTYGKSFFIAVPCAVLTVCAAALVCMKLPEIRLIEYIGKNTLFYLGVHRVLIYVADTVFRAYKTEIIYIAIASVIVYLILAPAAKLCEKYTPFVIGRPGGITLFRKRS